MDLPRKWQIVCTANPEGGDYSVTPMDPAMLTRMLHMTMIFDVKSWAKWAMNSGVDPRGIAFVLTYPEVITGERTTPRTLTQFFDQIASIDDLKNKLELVNVLARSALDDITATTFLAFVNDGVTQLVEPADILDAKISKLLQSRLVIFLKVRVTPKGWIVYPPFAPAFICIYRRKSTKPKVIILKI